MAAKRSASDPVPPVSTEKASRGIWLVKVPRYLSEVWEKRAGEVVGRLVHQVGGETIFHSNITEVSTDKQSVFNSSQNKVNQKSTDSKIMDIPQQHKFITRDVKNQSFAVLSEDKSGLEEDSELVTGKLSIEGRIVIRAECQPPNSVDYMKMKIQQIQKISQPKKTVQQVERAVVKYKPINAHQEHIAKDKAKKEGTRAVRLEKDDVVKLLFHAFEKHQFYRQIDLQKLTNQPAGMVRDVLNDIGLYHDSAPHKSMWELKPEYRNYNEELAKNIEKKEVVYSSLFSI
uniref:General transcription factor IIF subunit 2 n=1 Tax=Meloidogyne enterolobii TaxID=390850 RepID=A0A6V7VYV2_MELEN|nr:unnamed protein product [Meloidogyne enterolobii]